MTRPLILLSNDDGYRARGIRLLKQELAKFADVVLCAPDVEQSTASHALSLNRPLRLENVGDAEFAVDGTPADCVYVALHCDRILPGPPALVVSGLNHGLNLGNDVFYSGTVAAAREGALKGHPALALSAASDADFERAARAGAGIAQSVIDTGLAGPMLFNVNFPATGSWELRSTRLGLRQYEDEVEFRRDPRGREYLWIGGAGVQHDFSAGSDTEAHDEGAVGITPLVLDLWDSKASDHAGAIVRAHRGSNDSK
jgi:5'-nucleotidase